MIKNITLVLFKKWKRFNKMQHSRRSALLGIYPKKNSTTKNQVLRLFSRDSHIENFVIFSKFLKINLHVICLIRLPNQNVTIKAEIVKNFFFPVNNIRMDNQIDKKICNCDNISTFKTFKGLLDLFRIVSLFTSIFYRDKFTNSIGTQFGHLSKHKINTEKYCNFTYFSGVDILQKVTVSTQFRAIWAICCVNIIFKTPW